MGDDDKGPMSNEVAFLKRAKECALNGDGRGVLGYLNRSSCYANGLLENSPTCSMVNTWEVFTAYVAEGLDQEVERVKEWGINGSKSYDDLASQIRDAHKRRNYGDFVGNLKGLLNGGINLRAIAKSSEGRGRMW